MVNAFALARVHPWHMLCVRHTQVRPAAGIIGPQNRVAITLQYMGPGPKVDANLELSDSQPYWWSDIPNDACLELVITMASSPLATYRHHVVCVKKSTLTKSQSQVWFSLYIYVYLQLSSFIYHQLVCFYKWLMWVCSVGKESIVGSICIRNYRSLLWGASCFIFIDIFACGSWVGLKQYTTIMWQIWKSQSRKHFTVCKSVKFIQIVSNGRNCTLICIHSDVWSCETNAEEVTTWYCMCYVQLSVNSFLYPFSGYSFWRFSDENLKTCGCCNEAWILLSCYEQQKLFQAYFKLSAEEWAAWWWWNFEKCTNMKLPNSFEAIDH